ncbi:hypothetical protein Tco_1322308, partial [Tanacetum coccineum]
MSSASSAVTYTSVYTDFEPGRVFWGADEEISDGAPSDDEAPMEDQPLPIDSSPVPLSPGYVSDFDPEEDSEEEHANYHADGGYGDDEPLDDDNDDDDTDDEDEEPFEDEGNDEEKEEEEHLAPAESSAIHVVDHVPSARDTEA